MSEISRLWRCVRTSHLYTTSLRCCCLCLTVAATADAQLLDYGTYSGYGLGKGIRGNDYQTALSACISGRERKLSASHSDVRASIVFNSYEYEQAFHIDQNAKASFLGIAGGGEDLHIGQETGRSGSAFDVILEAYSESDSDTIDNIKWDQSYADKVASQDASKLQEVRTDCGDRYIETVFNEARLFLVLHVSADKQSSLLALRGSINAKVDVGILSASGSLGGDETIKSANKSGALSMEVHSEGLGRDVPSAGALKIADSDGLVEMAKKLSDYLTALKVTGQPVKYRLAPLPGLGSGNLSERQIFDDLRDLKAAYFEAEERIRNVEALAAVDPRRRFLDEPKADATLQSLKFALKAHVALLAQAHDRCRKVATLIVCNEATGIIGGKPPISNVELPPAGPPVLNPYTLAIDGTPLAPGQVSGMWISGRTLMESARAVYPTAHNVDLLAPMWFPYWSYLDVLFSRPQPPYPPLTVGGIRLYPSDLNWPRYWGERPPYTVPILIAHADDQHPCRLLTGSTGLTFVEPNCVVGAGIALRDAARVDEAEFVTNYKSGWPTAIGGLGGTPATNCFGQIFPGQIALVSVEIDKKQSEGNQTSGHLTVLVPVGGSVSIAVIDEKESYDAQGWNAVLASRTAGAQASQRSSVGASNCSGRVQ